MKKILSLLFLVSFIQSMNAQDTIYTSSKQYILAQIQEIDEQVIAYKKTQNLQGPVYKINTNKVYKIVFENGVVEYYKNKNITIKNTEQYASSRTERIIKNKLKYPRDKDYNLLSAGLYLQDLYSEQIIYYGGPRRAEKTHHGFYVQYERLLFNEVVGVNIMPMISMNQNQIGFKTGIKAYPKYFGRTRIGLGIQYSLFKQAYHKSFYTTNNNTSWNTSIDYTDTKAVVGSISFNSNLLFHITPKTLIHFSADIGGPIHINKTKNLPKDWYSRSTIYGTLGMASLGITRRF